MNTEHQHELYAIRTAPTQAGPALKLHSELIVKLNLEGRPFRLEGVKWFVAFFFLSLVGSDVYHQAYVQGQSTQEYG
jgi:hypothetical protein